MLCAVTPVSTCMTILSSLPLSSPSSLFIFLHSSLMFPYSLVDVSVIWMQAFIFVSRVTKFFTPLCLKTFNFFYNHTFNFAFVIFIDACKVFWACSPLVTPLLPLSPFFFLTSPLFSYLVFATYESDQDYL